MGMPDLPGGLASVCGVRTLYVGARGPFPDPLALVAEFNRVLMAAGANTQPGAPILSCRYVTPNFYAFLFFR